MQPEPTFGAMLDMAKRLYFQKQYNQAVLLCGTLAHRLLARLYHELLPTIPSAQQRLEVVRLEAEISSGRGGFDRFTLGQMAALFERASLFRLAESALDVELGSASQIDFRTITHCRNQSAHLPEELSPTVAGFVLFQTAALWDSLRSLAEDRWQKDREEFSRPSSAAPDPIGYLRAKLSQLGQRPRLPAEVRDGMNEALEYAQINPEDALFKLRKILELLARDLHEREIGKVGDLTLDPLLKKLREKDVIPNRIFKHMEVVKQFGNKGAHPGEEKYYLADVENTFLALIIAVEWYLDRASPVPPVSRS